CSSSPQTSSTAPGSTKPRSFAVRTSARKGMREKPLTASSRCPEVCAMDSTSSTPGIRGWPGKCPSNTVEVSGTWARQRMRPLAAASSSTRSTIWKYSRRTTLSPARPHRGSPRASGRLRGHQLVDACAQILQDEIVLGRRLALVDFLHPLLDRHLDAEFLVD